MVERKTGRVRRLVLWGSGFLAVFLGIFFGIQFFTKTGVFRVPGVIYYDDSLTSSEIDELKAFFNSAICDGCRGLDLDKDVTISAKEYTARPKLGEGEFLTEVFVPVADFYETRTDVSEYEEGEYKYIPFGELDFSFKLLGVDGEYYLDEFDSGARFRVLKFSSEKYEEIEELIEEARDSGSWGFDKEFPEKETTLTFAQTGVTALSRGMNSKLVKMGGDAKAFAENIGEFLSGFDLTHTSNESSFTKFANGSNICSDTRFIDTLTAIGLDIVELTGNHNQDCGDEAAADTIDIYKENGIKTVGGGKTAEEAAKPLLLNEKGSGITFLAYNLSTGGATLDATPGANQYYEENAVSEIAAAKKRGDFVIVDIQYYECNAYASEYEDPICDKADSAAGDQVGFFRHLIDLGADMVVGTSAHQPQTFELYEDGVIYYGLGNLFFDQIWWPGTTRSLVLVHYFYNGKLLQTKIVPTVYDKDMKTKLLDEETTRWFLKRLIDVVPEGAKHKSLKIEEGKAIEVIDESGGGDDDSGEDDEFEAVDLQPTVDEWVGSVKNGNKSVLIYDLDRKETVGEYNTKEDYGTASLYKLFVVYEGYRRVQSGEWDGEAKAGATGKTINKCLDLAIRESNSDCAETLWAKIGHDELDKIIEKEFKITKSDISKLVSNVSDIRKIMQIFYEHSEIKDEKLVAMMKDSFLDQPVTTYNWRQGLPSGFSEEVKVYNKVGWEYNPDKSRWNIYHDTAILEFPELKRHFIVVVMTNCVDYKDIAKLGTMIEGAVKEELD